MATLVSPGVSVTITDESFFIPAAAPTVPLLFIATADEKLQPDGVTPAAGTYEHNVIRTLTTLTQSTTLYGVPRFLTDTSDNQLHGDARNEYGLFAINQYLGIGNTCFAIRANVNLNDQIDSILTMWSAHILEARTLLETITQKRIDDFNTSNGYYVGNINFKQTVTKTEFLADAHTALSQLVYTSWSFRSVEATFEPTQSPALSVFSNGYSNPPVGAGFEGLTGVADAWILANLGTVVTTQWTPEEAGQTLVDAAADYQYTIEFRNEATLGVSDNARRGVIVTALQAAINSSTDARSEQYEFNLILCPGYPEVVDEMIALAADVKDEAFVIGDPPMNLDPEAVVNWATDALSNRRHNVAVAYYYPHALASNLDGVNVYVAASGVALRTYAFSDNVSQVWFAPAGTQRGLVTGVDQVGYISGTLGTATTFVPIALSPGQRDNLYQYNTNVNPIANLIGRGIVVFGQKTSSPNASARDRVNVERLLRLIKRQLRKNLVPFLFEPNDKITRNNAKAVVDGYLGDIMTKRGLYDFATVCDDTNNTPQRIDANELWIDVALKPVKAVEFIYVPLRVVATGAAI